MRISVVIDAAKGVMAMLQQGQLVELRTKGRDGKPLCAYRYRVGGRGGKRVQRGGFASERDAREALELTLETLRGDDGAARTLTLAELVDECLAQHDAGPVTIAKLGWLLAKAVAAFGDRRLGELRSREIAAWRMTIPSGHRFEATQALRHVLDRAVIWQMIQVNPAKLGVDNPQPPRKEQRPFDSWEQLLSPDGRGLPPLCRRWWHASKGACTARQLPARSG
jgi:hypothetical protein